MADQKTVSVPLPPNMSAEEFNKLFATFQKARVTGKARELATRTAVKQLITAHQPEYDRYYNTAYAEAGGQ